MQCVKILHQYVELEVKFIKFHNYTFGTASEINKISPQERLESWNND